MASQIGQNYSTQVEANVNHMVNMHLWDSYAYFIMGF